MVAQHVPIIIKLIKVLNCLALQRVKLQIVPLRQQHCFVSTVVVVSQSTESNQFT